MLYVVSDKKQLFCLLGLHTSCLLCFTSQEQLRSNTSMVIIIKVFNKIQSDLNVDDYNCQGPVATVATLEPIGSRVDLPSCELCQPALLR